MLGRSDAGTINSSAKDVQADTPNGRILNPIAELTRVFFDKTLRGMSAPALDLGRAPAKEIQIERFGAAAK